MSPKDKEEFKHLYAHSSRHLIQQRFPELTWDTLRGYGSKLGVKRTYSQFDSKPDTILIIPDVHLPYGDEKALKVVYQLIADIKPQTIVQIGDLIDCYAISTFDKDPTRVLGLQVELEAARSFWGKIQEASPWSRLIWRCGNHEDRLRKQLWKNPAFSGLVDLTIPALCRLVEYGVEWIDYGERLILKGLMLPHGTAVRSQSGASAHAELISRQTDGVSGHTHRAGMVMVTSESGTYTWIESGHLSSNTHADYMGDKVPNWQHAVTVGVHSGTRWHLTLVPIYNGELVYGGKLYK